MMEDREVEESNATLQNEELEALEAIYGGDFALEFENPPTFSITIKLSGNNDKENDECALTITFPSDYPQSVPPIYQLSIPWLRGQEKQELCSSLEEIYLNHIGESIVYLWVEKLREILQGKITDGDNNAIMPEQFEELSIQSQSEEFKEDFKDFPSKNMSPVQISTGEPFTDRKSTFQAHVAHVTDLKQIKSVLSELYKNKKIATATHNIYAYRICKEGSQNITQDCEDDGETHAGGRLLHLLQILDCRNVMIVVTRWYGGIQLHGDRFKHINNVARTLLDAHGYILQPKWTKKAK